MDGAKAAFASAARSSTDISRHMWEGSCDASPRSLAEAVAVVACRLWEFRFTPVGTCCSEQEARAPPLVCRRALNEAGRRARQRMDIDGTRMFTLGTLAPPVTRLNSFSINSPLVSSLVSLLSLVALAPSLLLSVIIFLPFKPARTIQSPGRLSEFLGQL
jgi:hypothetical protein